MEKDTKAGEKDTEILLIPQTGCTIYCCHMLSAFAVKIGDAEYVVGSHGAIYIMREKFIIFLYNFHCRKAVSVFIFTVCILCDPPNLGCMLYLSFYGYTLRKDILMLTIVLSFC